VTFNTPFDLPADHYFFVPQVSLFARGGGHGDQPPPQRPSRPCRPRWLEGL